MSSNKNKLTSITEAKAHSFFRSAKIRGTLPCDLITGFHLVKLNDNSGSWRYRYTDDLGKRRVATIGPYSEYKPVQAAEIALNWSQKDSDPLKTKKTKQTAAIKREKIAQQRTLRNYLEKDYRRYMDSWKPESAKTNEQRFNKHFSDILDKDMTTINRADIRAWQEQAEQRGLAYSTIQRTYSALKALLNHATENEVVPENPLNKVKLTPPKKEEQERLTSNQNKEDRRILTRDELEGIFKGLELFAKDLRAKRNRSIQHGKKHLTTLDDVGLPHWFIPFLHLALHTGLRPGDIYSLTWEELNINFGRLTKHPEKTTSKAIRSGKKPALIDMPLNQAILSTMKTWHSQQGKPDRGLVFPSERTGRQMDKNAHDKPWTSVKKFGEINPKLNFYAFRHHFISTLVKIGMPLLTIAKLVGHKSVDMIQEHYGHLCELQACEAVNILADSLSVSDKGAASI